MPTNTTEHELPNQRVKVILKDGTEIKTRLHVFLDHCATVKMVIDVMGGKVVEVKSNG